MADIAGNTGTKAILIPGEDFISIIDRASDADWFRATLQAGLTYQFIATGTGSADSIDELQLAVLNDTGGYIESDGGGWEDRRTVVVEGGTGGEVFAAITSRGAIGEYVVSWVASDKVRNDVETTVTAKIGAATKGVIDCYLDSDWYAVNVKAGVTYTFRVEGDGTAAGIPQPELAIRNERGVLLQDAWFGGGYREISWKAESDGTLFLDIGGDYHYGINTDTGKFVLMVTSDQRVLSGSRKSDDLTGGDTETFITGKRGNDTLQGGEGNDTILGGSGNDLLDGGADADRLQGNAGQDTINGGAGADWLDGSSGNDRLIGGADADVFHFAKGGGTDRISDFLDGVDRIAFGGRIAFEDLAIRQLGATVVITAGNLEVLVENMLASDLTRADFQFV